jgi:hypothetical protein
MVLHKMGRDVPPLKSSNINLASILGETEIKKENLLFYVFLDIFYKSSLKPAA